MQPLWSNNQEKYGNYLQLLFCCVLWWRRNRVSKRKWKKKFVIFIISFFSSRPIKGVVKNGRGALLQRTRTRCNSWQTHKPKRIPLPSIYLLCSFIITYRLSLFFPFEFPGISFYFIVVYRLWNSRECVFWRSLTRFLFSFCYYLFKNYKKESSRNANGWIHWIFLILFSNKKKFFSQQFVSLELRSFVRTQSR